MTAAMNESNKPFILMYHGIVDDLNELPPTREAGASRYDVTQENFAFQIALLHNKGFKIVPYSNELTDKEVVVTFDDGEVNNFTKAYEVLKGYECKAYFFIIPDRVGNQGYMTWEQIKELSEAGMFIGSHGLTHSILTELSADELIHELSESKRIIEEQLGVSIDVISIPRGFCNDAVLRKAYEVGYKYVFISQKPRILTEAGIERMDIQSSWTMKRFAQALEGKMPIKEKFLKGAITITRKILGDKGYNRLRTSLMRKED
ncbi:MAG: peptidoglycan/xylan/chitin deacetylase (PgdA/CDA1 family) [Candidatus Omnitrophota bacterium]